jgi:outer membrane lipoprotein-sorting protein
MSRRARWAVPVVAVTAVAAAIGAGAIAGASSPDLPEKTAAELLVGVAAAGQPFSGTVVQTSRLGLPEMPDSATMAGGPVALLTGSHTARIWYSSPEQARVALMDQMDETNVIRDGADVWIWSSQSNTAQHAVVPPHESDVGRVPTDLPVSPDAAAAAVLAAIDPSTEVVVDGTAEVAGRAAYELVVSPRDDRSLIEDVRLAVDGATSMPLRVQVNSTGGDEPAFEVGFTSVTFEAPSDDVYRFNPPPGSTVEELDLAKMGAHKRSDPGADFDTGRVGQRPTVVGEDWTTVLVVPDVTLPAPDEDGVLDALLGGTSEVSGPYGSGRLLETELVSVLLLDDGRLLAGAVEPSVLFDAAAGTAS